MKRALVPLVLVLTAACGSASAAGASAAPIVVGAIYPTTGSQGPGGSAELAGLRAALRRSGAQVRLDVIDAETPAQAAAAVDTLVDRDHVVAIIGTYGSELAAAASARADQRHVLYWETGAVADSITAGRTWVFRTVATGGTLGRTAVQFTADDLIPRAHLGHTPTAVIVAVNDVYGRSVADAEESAAGAAGVRVIDRIDYQPLAYDPIRIAQRLAADAPDFAWDVSYVDDGVAIWKQVEAGTWRPLAAVGTSSAFCMPLFGQRMGAGAVGLYAADKPDGSIRPAALSPAASSLLASAIRIYQSQTGLPSMDIPAVAGFVGGWVLFHEVLPSVSGPVSAASLRAAALKLDLPQGSEINGAGVRFAPPGQADAGQNLLAASVVGQWQAPGKMKVVYPSAYATAPVEYGLT